MVVKSWKVSGCLDLWAEIRNQKHNIPFLFLYRISLLKHDWNTRPYILMEMEDLCVHLHWVLIIVKKFLTVVPCICICFSNHRVSLIDSIGYQLQSLSCFPPPPLPSSVICFQFSALRNEIFSKEEKWPVQKTRKHRYLDHKTCGRMCMCPHKKEVCVWHTCDVISTVQFQPY